MRVAKFGSEKNLSELVDRLFEIKKTDAETRARVEARLVSANPHLTSYEHLPDGVPIVVPDIKGIAHTTENESFLPFLAELSGQVKRAVTSLREAAKETEKSNRDETRTVLRQLKTKKVNSLLGEEPEDQKRLREVTTELKTRLKDSEALQKFQAGALDEIASDLIDLGKLATSLASRAVSTQRLTATGVKPADVEEPSSGDYESIRKTKASTSKKR